MECVFKNTFFMVICVLVFVNGGNRVEAQVHHVVGQDPGWEVATNIASWASGRDFFVGDFLWFSYSNSLDKDYVVEVKSKEEFESCDVSNPIKMYTNGLDQISLQEEGIRYFASANPDKCKNGLKLPVQIKSKSTADIQSSSSSFDNVLAKEPTSPSSSTKICGSILMIIGAIIIYQMGI
ncbi:unnamed protein product [Amaranthus hypochondriacus]